MKKLLLLLVMFASVAVIQAQVNITFNVDMKYQLLAENFDPAADVVEIRGSFNAWSGGATMTDADGDSVYTLQVQAPANETAYYKFVYVIEDVVTWESDPNRELVVADQDIVVDAVPFDGMMGSGEPATVEFSVDMTVIAANGFLPGTDKVYIAGSFTDWATSAIELTDTDGDTVYTLTHTSSVGGDMLYFKFIYGDTATSITWESDPNRNLYLFDGDNSYFDYWDRQEPNQQVADGNIQFTVDMAVMEEVGLFDPNVDSLHLYGSFNGWGANDPVYAMNQDFLVLNEWFLEMPFSQEPINAEQFYKFYVVLKDTNDIWTDTWERPISIGGGNRTVLFEGSEDQEVETMYYDGVLPEYVIEDGTNIEITFRVDMTDATGITFVAGDKVYWLSEEPAFIASQGWADSDTMTVLELTDSNNDMIYEGTLSVSGPSWNGFEYRYGYVHQGEWVQEPSGYGDFAYRVRYCEMNGERSFVQPYTAPIDSWLDQEDKSSQSETSPAGLTSVKPVDLVAERFTLSQNYPNPFNPSTTIKFSVPESNLTSLKIYNILGQQVATLINEELSTGSYEIKFNASNLSSGVYFYTITSGDFSASRKMMLLK